MMNRTRGLRVGTGLALVAAAACNTDKITELNRNPNSPEDVPASTLFTNAVRSAVNDFLGAGYNLREAEFVTQHFAEAQYPDEDRYARLGPGDTQARFTGPYVNELEDLTKVVQKGTAANDPGMIAPARILQTWTLSYITDTWGDIPYFQALRGDSAGGSISPAYDAQKDIYADLFKVLDAASKSLTGASGSLGAADPIYGGSPKEWQKFANSLRARLALRLVNVDRATTDAQLRAAIAATSGLITSNADNAELRWPGDGVYNNPWADFFKTRDDNRLSQTLVNILIANSDPRLPIYAQPSTSDTLSTGAKCSPPCYSGMPNGLTASAAGRWLNVASRAGAVFYPGPTAYGVFGGTGASFPSFIITAAEVNFILAEAAERGLAGLTAAQAKGYYEAGIRASMDQWGVTNSTAINNYIASAPVAYQSGTPGLTRIAQQKWIALFSDGGTAWAEWRRTCVPSTVKPGPAATSSTVPRRFQYPPTEYSVNATSLKAAVDRQGSDAFATRVYWDTAPTTAPTFVTGCGQR